MFIVYYRFNKIIWIKVLSRLILPWKIVKKMIPIISEQINYWILLIVSYVN